MENEVVLIAHVLSTRLPCEPGEELFLSVSAEHIRYAKSRGVELTITLPSGQTASFISRGAYHDGRPAYDEVRPT